MIGELESKSSTLLSLYQDGLRKFLEKQRITGLEGLDRQAEILRLALRRPDRVNIGFVGESQVGKSTIINALLDRRALPSGGVGPLTAQATRVAHGEEDRLQVTYHGRGALNKLVFALRRNLEMRGQLDATTEDTGVAVEADAEDDGDVLVEEALNEDGQVEGASDRAQKRATYMFAQARRMLGADAKVPEPVLLDALITVLDRPPLGPADAIAPFLERCAELRARLGTQELIVASEIGGSKAFQAELKLRAADWLSPLVAQLSLELAAPQVQGLSMVDLPGIGVVGDAAANEAQRFVETDGDALVLVFRNNGVPETVADLLEKTGVITKLLFAGRDGVSPIQVILVVTHLDNVAKAQLSLRAQEAMEFGGDVPDRHVLFRDLASEMEEKVREQVVSALLASKSFEDLEASQRDARQQVVARLASEMRVVCVVAPDYLEKKVGPDLSLAFLSDSAATGIPRLRQALHDLAADHARLRSRDIRAAHLSLLKTLDAHLVSMRKSLDDGRGAALAQWERFCDELREFAEPLRLEMQALHGEVAGTLRRGLLERIDALCGEAEIRGLKRLRALLREANALSYQSLNAALRRDGVWERRNVNFPEKLTLAVVDTIAAEWEPQIVEAIRAEVRRLADRDLKLVEQLVQRARQLDAKVVEETPVEEQKKILQQNSRSAVTWTKQQLQELTDAVRSKLRDAVGKPIEGACRQAIRAGHNTRSGAKGRILEVFDTAGGEALSEARRLATKVLKDAYRGLLRKLEDGFLREFHDPVQAALDALTDQTGQRARRSDAQTRRALLESTNTYLAALHDAAIPDEPSEPVAEAA